MLQSTHQNFTKWFVILCLTVGSCKTQSTNKEVNEPLRTEGLQKAYSGEVTFALVNATTDKMMVESVEHLYIEVKKGDVWERVPYVPCACETPCKTAVPLTLAAGEQLEVKWEGLSRKCVRAVPPNLPETIEERVAPGTYRLVFTVVRSKDGMRQNPEKYWVTFRMK